MDCEEEEFEAFLKEVKEAGGYEVVILEFSCVKMAFAASESGTENFRGRGGRKVGKKREERLLRK